MFLLLESNGFDSKTFLARKKAESAADLSGAADGGTSGALSGWVLRCAGIPVLYIFIYSYTMHFILYY